MTHYDNLIIGAGIGGTYLAARLQKIKPKQSILIVDRNSCFGGRQISSITYDGVAIELGGIRFYESIHTRVAALARKYKLPLIEYLPSELGQVMHLRGTRYNIADVYPDSDERYNINKEEKQRNPFILLKDNLNKVVGVQNIHKLETRINLISKNLDLTTKTFRDLIGINISQENFQRISDILSYCDLLKNNAAFIVTAIDFLAMSNKSNTQYRFAEGYSSLTRKIAKDNNITEIKFKNLKGSKNISCVFNTEIIDIIRTKNKMWEVICGYTKINSLEQTDNKIKKIIKIKVKNIYYTGTIKFLERIYQFNNTFTNYLKNSFVSPTGLRIYLRYSTDWMTARGIGLGKSITTQYECQIVHYANKYVMFYIFGSQNNCLFSVIPPKQMQKELIKPSNQTKPLIDRCNEILKNTFGLKKELPPVTDIAWMYWQDPASMWAARNLQTLENRETLVDRSNRLMFPFGMNGNFYILSNEIGFNSAWCEGSLENVDYLLHKKYKQPLFGPDTI